MNIFQQTILTKHNCSTFMLHTEHSCTFQKQARKRLNLLKQWMDHFDVEINVIYSLIILNVNSKRVRKLNNFNSEANGHILLLAI